MLTCHVCPPFLHDKVITTHYSGFRLGTRSVNSSLMCMQLCAWGQKVKYRHQVSTSQTIPRHRLHQESSRRSSLPSSRRMCTIVTLLSPDHQDTLLTSCSVYCVLNAATCLITGTHHGLSHLLHEELHWLNIPERIHYKLGVTLHRCL